MYVIVNRSNVNKQGTRLTIKKGKHQDLIDYIEDLEDEINNLHDEDSEKTPVRFVKEKIWNQISKGLGKFEVKTLQIIRDNEIWLGISHEENMDNVVNAIRTGREATQHRKEKSEQERVDKVFSTRTANLLKTLLQHGRNKYTAHQAKHAQLKDVLKLYPEELLIVPGFGKKRAFEVLNVLAQYDLITEEMHEKAKDVITNYKPNSDAKGNK
jgi:hypothetical protein